MDTIPDVSAVVPTYNFQDHFNEYDDEYVTNVFANEDKYHVPKDYIIASQNLGITEEVRYQVVEWLFELVDEYNIGNEVVAGAINTFDRFLSKLNVHKKLSQLIASAALIISCKISDGPIPTMRDMTTLCGNSFTESDLRDTELLILHTLGWDICPFVPHTVVRLDFKNVLLNNIRLDMEELQSTTEFFIDMALCESSYLQYKWTTIAGAALVAAVERLAGSQSRAVVEERMSGSPFSSLGEGVMDIRRCAFDMASSLEATFGPDADRMDTEETDMEILSVGSLTTPHLGDEKEHDRNSPTNVQDMNFL